MRRTLVALAVGLALLADLPVLVGPPEAAAQLIIDEPAKPRARRCETASDCRSGQICRGGACRLDGSSG